MLIKTVIAFLFTACLWSISTAQGQEVIYLKNGEKIKAEVIKYSDKGNFTIQYKNGEVSVVKAEDIEFVSFLGDLEEERIIENVPKSRDTKNPSTIYYNIGLMGLYSSVDREISFEDYAISGGLTFSLGKQLSEYFGAGVELGYISYNYADDIELFSLGIELKAKLNDKKVSPFIVASGGYGFGSSNNNFINIDGGYFVHPAIGLILKTERKERFSLDLGYRFQDASYRIFTFNGNERFAEVLYKKFTARFSLAF